MDHLCHKCGHSIEDGKPFCSQCGAPQIRVSMPEPAERAVESSVPAHVLAANPTVFSLDPPLVSGSLGVSSLSTGIEWSRAIPPCAVAALIGALVMALGLMVPLLAVLGAGFLAVTLYHRRNPAWSANARSGAQLGAVCGLLFFGMAAIFESLSVALFHTGGQVRQKMIEALQQAATRSADPQVQAALENLKTPQGLAVMLILGLVVLFLVSIAVGSIAGALTGAFLGRRGRS
jgi:predicted  nucleic acid-binding Zn-ribbon protein